jgi:tetratricopeptide (TPR) repeat protein
MKASQKSLPLAGAIIVLITLVAYIPAMRGGYIWDDNAYVTENLNLRTLEGLGNIWFQYGAIPQYYPLVHSSFWLEYHLWKLHPFGYHLINVLLHGLNGVLLWLVLRYLSVPGAWLAAAIFALHPVQVESVAWITERKNVLSGFFYLAALLVYLRFYKLVPDHGDPLSPSPIDRDSPDSSKPSWRLYLFALFLYVCGLLSKTVTCSWPAVILLILWWKRNRILWRDIRLLTPFFLVGAMLGLTTLWIEKHFVGAQGEAWTLSSLERCLVAGRALWFYAGKLFWPHQLTFIYPHWQIDAGIWWQYLFPLAAVAVVLCLWLLRGRIGKGPLVAVLFFAGTLVPALGFFNVFPMQYSFVADHFQYLASIGLIVLAVAWSTELCRRFGAWSQGLGSAVGVGVLLVFAILVWQQGKIYKDLKTLWLDTISKNPDAWMAQNNLGIILSNEGKLDEAIIHYSKAIQVKPDAAKTHINLAHTLTQQGKLQEAVVHYAKALRIKPDTWQAHINLGSVLYELGDADKAMYHYIKVLEIKPESAEVHYNIAQILASQGKLEEAIAHNLEALRINPDFPQVLNNLAWTFSTHRDPKFRNGDKAVELAERACALTDYKNPFFLDTLAAAYARANRFPEAVEIAHKAANLALDEGQKSLALEIEKHLQLYQAGKPFDQAGN